DLLHRALQRRGHLRAAGVAGGVHVRARDLRRNAQPGDIRARHAMSLRRAIGACAALLAAGVMLAAVILLSPAAPPPSFEQVRASWVPSEAWLLDRNGAELAVRRVDLGARRLAWEGLDQIAPAVRATVVQAEDR